MNELARLRQALRRYELSEQSFLAARDELRDAVRTYLQSKTEERGDGVALAKKLGISIVQLSNLKHGYSIASADYAQFIMKTCGDDR
jgi:hypothetical protein